MQIQLARQRTASVGVSGSGRDPNGDRVPNDLDEEVEPDVGLVMNMPEIETEGFLLIVKIMKVELAKFGIDKPAIQVRMSFGAMEVLSRPQRVNYESWVNDELRMPTIGPRSPIASRLRSSTCARLLAAPRPPC